MEEEEGAGDDNQQYNESEQKSNIKSAAKSKLGGFEDGKSMLSQKAVVLDDFQVRDLFIQGCQLTAIEAVKKGDSQMFMKLGVHKETFDPNYIIDEVGNTLLIQACQMGQEDAVAQLLRNPKINVNAKNFEGVNAVWVATSQGFSKIITLLASKKADLLCLSEHGMNVLHVAVNKNYPDIVKMLLVNYSFPLNQQTKQGLTALSISVFRQHHECLELLINAGADLELYNAQNMTPLQLALKIRDNIAAKMLIQGGSQAYFTEFERAHQSPIFYIVRSQNVVIMETINGMDADFMHRIRTSEDMTLLHYASKHQLDDVVSYLSVISPHEEINSEDPYGFTPLLYYLFKENYDMCSKLIFRGADVNHIYQLHNGKTAVAIMVEQRNDLAVKFLLDKLANPHYVFGADNKDACDLAKENGLDKRFYVLAKCNGEHKIFPRGDAVIAQVTDHRKEMVVAAHKTTDFKHIMEAAKKLDDHNDPKDNVEWIHDELQDGLDNYDPETAKRNMQGYKSSRFDIIENINNNPKKKGLQEELEEYKDKFQVDEAQKVKLQPFEYPTEIASEQQIKLEADRIRRQIEFDRLEADRLKALQHNKDQIKKQRFDMINETQALNQRLESDYSNYMEVDVREQFLIDERISAYRRMMDMHKAEQVALVTSITNKAAEEEKKRIVERSRKVNDQKLEQDIVLKAEAKKNEILHLQEILHKNAQEQRDKERAIEKERRDVWNELTGIRKKIDYDQVKMEALHLKKQVENDFLEKEIQDRIRQARLALDLAIGQPDANGNVVDGKIDQALQRRGNQSLNVPEGQTAGGGATTPASSEATKTNMGATGKPTPQAAAESKGKAGIPAQKPGATPAPNSKTTPGQKPSQSPAPAQKAGTQPAATSAERQGGNQTLQKQSTNNKISSTSASGSQKAAPVQQQKPSKAGAPEQPKSGTTTPRAGQTLPASQKSPTRPTIQQQKSIIAQETPRAISQLHMVDETADDLARSEHSIKLDDNSSKSKNLNNQLTQQAAKKKKESPSPSPPKNKDTPKAKESPKRAQTKVEKPKPSPRADFQKSTTQKQHSPEKPEPLISAQPIKQIPQLKIEPPKRKFQDTIAYTGSDFDTNKQLSLYDEIRLADEMINQLSKKINKFAPQRPQNSRGSSGTLSKSNSKNNLGQRGTNKTLNVKGGAQNAIQALKNQNARTIPSSPGKVPLQQNYMKSDVQDFIKNHQQVEQEKKVERQRALSSQKSGRQNSQLQNIAPETAGEDFE